MVKAATPYFAAVVIVVGCGQILDIEDAHLVSAAGGDGASATGTAGGSDVTPSEGGRMADGGTGSVAGDGGRVNAGGTTDAGYGGGGGGDVPSAGAGNPRSPCDDYCSVITRDCTGKDAQFIDADACQQACRLYPPGTPGETQGNTLACRRTYANKARSEPYTYCTWAGPGGDGRCGANCDGFCTLMMAACTVTSTGAGHEYFDSFSDCQAACNELDDVGSYNTSDRSLQKGADTVQCRLYHVGAALAEDDSFTHCSHAIGDRLCVDAPSDLETSGP